MITLLYTHLLAWQPQLTACLATLPPTEQAHAQQFRQDRSAAQFIVGRTLLRQQLAKRLQQPSAHITLAYGEFGKPYLPGSDWHFNVAHSGDWVLLGLGRCPLGVDVERVPLGWDWQAVAERYFMPAELNWLAAQPSRKQAFAQLWTYKEACLKCSGQGILGLEMLTLQIQDGQLRCAGFEGALRALTADIWAAAVVFEQPLSTEWDWQRV